MVTPFFFIMEQVSLTPAGFDQDQTVVYKLGQIESKLEAILKRLDDKERAQDEEIKELKADVSKVKMQRAWLLGAAAVLAVIADKIWRLVIG